MHTVPEKGFAAKQQNNHWIPQKTFKRINLAVQNQHTWRNDRSVVKKKKKNQYVEKWKIQSCTLSILYYTYQATD